jgi:hypothetical protein
MGTIKIKEPACNNMGTTIASKPACNNMRTIIQGNHISVINKIA